MNVRESLATANENGLDGFFGSLLGVETQVFKILCGDVQLGASEVAARSI